ncbi:MAG TPA: Crp/Fnr family transcriptional regulator [Bdellovibrionales bacterium]|nr:Crp/Fnr family transcriptional regulator [Bdellovibrionales bacterium]
MGFNSLWKELPKHVADEFDAAARIVEKKRGETVYRAGEAPQGLYFVEQGLVGLTLIGAASGHEHLMRFFRRGQFFGHRALFSGETFHGSTIALEPTRLRLIAKPVVLKVLERNPELYREIVHALAQELKRCELQHVMILENQILARTAQALIYLKDLHPEHMWTRQEIANFCASTVSTVIKTMAELENMGLIRQDGRAIEILDREGLISLQDQ